MHVTFRAVKAKAETKTEYVLGVAVVLQVSHLRNGHNTICFVSSNTADLLKSFTGSLLCRVGGVLPILANPWIQIAEVS